MSFTPNNLPDTGKRNGPVTAAATLIGVGMGGFVDGILLHQILQWHNMLSAKLPPATLLNSKINMFWDGMFHAFVWMAVLIGILLLWKAVKNPQANLSNCLFAGGLIFGWGLFNVVEGIIDHQLLVLHNVRELSNNPAVYNYGFLIISVIMLTVGWLMIKSGRRTSGTLN